MFGSVELKALLDNPNVTSIDGISVAELKGRFTGNLSTGMSEADALKDISDIVTARSLSNSWTGLAIGKNIDGTVVVKASDAFFTNAGVPGMGAIDTTGGAPTSAVAMIHPPLKPEDFTRLGKGHNFLKGLKVTGKFVGPVGDLLELAVTGIVVIELLEAGDNVGAAREVSEFLGSFAAGGLAALAAAELASPLLVGGAVGWAAYAAIVLGAGIGGSFAGEGAVDFLFDSVPDSTSGTPLKVTVTPLNVAQQRVVGFVTNSLNEGVITSREALAVALLRERPLLHASQVAWGDAGKEGFAPDVQQFFDEFQLSLDEVLAGLDAGQIENFDQNGRLPRKLENLLINRFVFGDDQRVTPEQSLSVEVSADGVTETRTTRTSAAMGADGELTEIVIIGKRERNSFGELLNPPTTEFAVFDKNGDDGVSHVLTAGSIGSIFGSVLGRQIAGDSQFAQLGASALLGAVGNTLGQLAGNVFEGLEFGAAFDDAFSRLDTNLANAGIGAVSSFLVAELVSVLPLGDGIPAELLNTAGGAALAHIATNMDAILDGTATIGEVLNGATLPDGASIQALNLTSVVGSYVGSKLASEVVSFGTVGGQLGASLGGAVGPVILAQILGTSLAALGPLGFVVGVFVGTLLGGAIGSLFGGTPRSAADVAYDAESGEFEVSNIWSKHGGSKDAAKGIAQSVADGLNGVVNLTGGVLTNGAAVDAGTFGLSKSEFTYRDAPSVNRNKQDIDRRFDDVGGLVNFGSFMALSDMRIAGGDIYIKRALNATLDMAGSGDFDLQTLPGYLAMRRGCIQSSRLAVV